MIKYRLLKIGWMHMNKKDFPIFNEKIYGNPLIFLDSAASAQKSDVVLNAMEKMARTYYANVHRGAYYLSEMSTIAYEDARKTVAHFIGAREKDIIFVRGATEGLNLIAQTYGRTLKEGDEVLLTEAEHHSNLVPWQLLASEKGIIVKFAEVTEEGTLNIDDFKSKLSDKTKLVGITHMSNVLGTLFPIKEVTRLAHEAGALVLIDGCQGIVHEKVDVSEIGCDFYASSGHKLYGPTGIGFLYAKAELMNTLQPWQGGGDMVKTVTFEKSTFAETPARFEAGTPAIIEAIGFAEALRYLEKADIEEIEKHEEKIMNALKDGLWSIKGVKPLGDMSLKKSLVSFNIEGLHPQDVAMLLDKQGVAVRVGHHCAEPVTEKYGVSSSIRASIGLYNDLEDITAFIKALEKSKAILL